MGNPWGTSAKPPCLVLQPRFRTMADEASKQNLPHLETEHFEAATRGWLAMADHGCPFKGKGFAKEPLLEKGRRRVLMMRGHGSMMVKIMAKIVKEEHL